MKKRLAKAQPKDTIGSSFVGYLQASYQGLTDHLGLPNDRTKDDEWQSADEKTRVEWAFKTNEHKPTVVTIYDYKDPRPLEDVDLWHVGLKGDQERLKAFFSEQKLFTMIEKH